MKKKTKLIVLIIIIIVILLILLYFFPVLVRVLPRKMHNLWYKIPLEISSSEIGSDISYYDIGLKSPHEDTWYEFDNCNLIIEYFKGDVTNINQLDLVNGKTKKINGYEWYFNNSDKYFTNYKGNTYVVTITNNDKCNKINNSVMKTLKLK